MISLLPSAFGYNKVLNMEQFFIGTATGKPLRLVFEQETLLWEFLILPQFEMTSKQAYFIHELLCLVIQSFCCESGLFLGPLNIH